MEFEKHKEIILEALQDYRRWFEENPDPADAETVMQIDDAIEFVQKS